MSNIEKKHKLSKMVLMIDFKTDVHSFRKEF